MCVKKLNLIPQSSKKSLNSSKNTNILLSIRCWISKGSKKKSELAELSLSSIKQFSCNKTMRLINSILISGILWPLLFFMVTCLWLSIFSPSVWLTQRNCLRYLECSILSNSDGSFLLSLPCKKATKNFLLTFGIIWVTSGMRIVLISCLSC